MTSPLRSRFPEHFERPKKYFETLWRDALLVFDASALLNWYQLSSASLDDLRRLLEPVKERMWLVERAADEYVHNRRTSVGRQSRAAASIYVELNKTLRSLYEKWRKDYGDHVSAQVDEIARVLTTSVDDVKARLDKTVASVSLENDPVLDLVERLFEGRIGESYSAERLGKIYLEGQERYSRRVPPGFKDAEKGGQAQFGDLIFWFQTIDLAIARQKPILVIIDDRKEDWWLRNKDEIVGVHPDLVRELRLRAKQDVHFYDTSGLLDNLGRLQHRPPSPALAKEVRAIREEDIRLAEQLKATVADRDAILADVAKAYGVASANTANAVVKAFGDYAALRADLDNVLTGASNALGNPALFGLNEGLAAQLGRAAQAFESVAPRPVGDVLVPRSSDEPNQGERKESVKRSKK